MIKKIILKKNIEFVHVYSQALNHKIKITPFTQDFTQTIALNYSVKKILEFPCLLKK